MAVEVPELIHWTSPAPPENKYAAAAREVAEALQRQIAGEVRFAPGDRALYATDLSVFRQVPVGVVIPRTVDDVIATVAVCRDHDVPILARGGGTSLAGQTCNVAVVIDFSKYLHQILDYDALGRSAWVEPGVICDQLRHRAWRDHLTWAPDPATHASESRIRRIYPRRAPSPQRSSKSIRATSARCTGIRIPTNGSTTCVARRG